jgi:hypothetical protein
MKRFIWLVIVLLFTGCSGVLSKPTPESPTADPRTEIARSVALTVLAVSYPTVTPLPTWTPWPTAAPVPPTPVRSATPLPTRTSRPTPTATSAPVAVANKVVNLRAGPGTLYPVVGTTELGQSYAITGRISDSSWLEICCLGQKTVWVSAPVVEVAGNLDLVRVPSEVPPTPIAPTPARPQIPEGWVRYEDPAGKFVTYRPPTWSLFQGEGQNAGLTGVNITVKYLTFFKLVDSPVSKLDIIFGSIPVDASLGGGVVSCANIAMPKGNRHVQGTICRKDLQPDLDVLAPFTTLLVLLEPK